ncbi:MAG: phospho-sugar mutase [Actinomyces sp.]|nr:phospho-sugar mutase [Actinomyces sp.]MDN6429338.1 phospho-sugar mutase [Propionibacterium sp.]
MTSYDVDTVQAWIEDDPDQVTAGELADLLTAAQSGEAAAATELADRFSGLLEFGTAGLRGHLGGGPHRMNRAVVIRAAAGLMKVLHNHVGDGFTVVIGYDARYNSHRFALDTAAVAVAAGGRAFLLPRALPTPVTAFALRHLGCDAAVMVTASHNPPEDNGYKVYLGGRVVTDGGQGAQIVPPFDREIFEAITAVPSVASVARAESGWEVLGEDILEAYIDRAVSLVPAGAKDLRVVLTSMHGVGGAPALEALHRAGFSDVHVVAEQQEPDPDFPTVRFPNPEEPGALDLSMELARRVDADIILANDPDADRCSAAVPDPTVDGGWRQLSGDEVGDVLGLQAAREHRGEGSGEGVSARGAILANSIVSSRLLGRIAATHGVGHRNTLTGFKWISRVEGLVFGYEEALGYCVDPDHVRDKDGISACLKLATLAWQRKEAGESLLGVLDELAVEYGLHATSPLTIRVEDLSLIATGMANLRAHGVPSLAGSEVVETVDLSLGSPELPPTDGLSFRTAADDRVVARPSGTEPKLKCYCEVIVPVRGGDVAAARVEAAARLEAVKDDMRAALGI